MLTEERIEAKYENQGASLLARAPATIPWKTWATNDEWETMRNYLEQRLLGMRNWRTSWWSHWAELASNILPRRYHWLVVSNQMVRGSPINGQVVSSTPTQAVKVCSAGMMNGLSSPSRPWFKFRPPPSFVSQLDSEAQLWLDEVETRVYAVMSGSNFYDALNQMYEDQIVFGTAPVIIYEDRKDIIRCYNPCAGEYYLAVGSDNRVETFYREFVQTVAQVVEMFGPKVLQGTEIGELWNNKQANLETECKIGHAIEPNFPANRYGEKTNLGVVPGNYTWREYYWLLGKGTPQPLSVRGFHDQPFVAPRWNTRSNDPYGRSPGMEALPDIVQLHLMTRRHGEAVEKGVRPPLIADVTLKNEPSSILPGRVTYVGNMATNPGMKPVYSVDPRYVEFLEQCIERIENKVSRWFFNDVFLMISQMEGVQPRNELEISERRGEKLLVLGPVIEKNLNEGLSPAINRIVSIMGRRGLLPPKPRSLRNVPVEIVYVSVLALAQAAASTAGMERTLSMAGRMEAVWPGTIDNIDPDRFIRHYGEKLDFPSQDWRSDDEVKKLRVEHAKMAQARQQQEAAEKMAPAASHAADAAQTLAETDTGGGANALQMLLGQGGVNAGAGAGQ
jgi:hypothetical protein